jgi:hypothetical protein
MASPNRFRPVAIHFNGRKLAFITEGNAGIATNDEMQTGTEGYLGHSDGVATLTGSFTELVPVAGIDSNAVETALKKRYVTIGLLAGGKMYQSPCRVTNVNFSWNNRGGTTSCNVSFEGSEPTAI